jgi:5-methyltetrahydrofolate--homocysteine methyltransferase
MDHLQLLFDAVLNGDQIMARTVTEEALAAGADPMCLVKEAMTPAMAEVGRRFEAGEYFVPQLLLSARAMKATLVVIQPLLAERGAEPVGRVVVGTVKGDLHDIGKNLVAAVLEGGGFQVTDLGVNVTPDAFINAINELNPHIIGMSALLTSTMLCMKDTLAALQQAGVRDKVKVVIGGAPITRKFAEQIGADGFGSSAVEALALARKIMEDSAAEAA